MISLKPDIETPPRPASGAAREVVRSHLLMRTIVGVLGILLPILLVGGDILFLNARVSARGSLSAYYHSGMRDLFVGILAIAGTALVTYKVFRDDSRGENRLTIVAGIAAVGVALFPTGVPSDLSADPTPLQEKLGEGFVSGVHLISAVAFVGLLGLISIYFGIREAKRTDRTTTTKMSPAFWATFHFTMAGVIVAAVAVIAITKGFKVWDDHSLLIGESVAVRSFGASWLAKGLELDDLTGRT